MSQPLNKLDPPSSSSVTNVHAGDAVFPFPAFFFLNMDSNGCIGFDLVAGGVKATQNKDRII